MNSNEIKINFDSSVIETKIWKMKYGFENNFDNKIET